MKKWYIHIFILSFLLQACGSKDEDQAHSITFKLEEIAIDNKKNQDVYSDIEPKFSALLTFSDQIDQSTINTNIKLRDTKKNDIRLSYSYDNDKTIEIKTVSDLDPFSTYELIIWPNLKSKSGQKILTGKTYTISTNVSSTDKFPRITDNELLELVQKQTFKYFWDFGHPTSGMARERSTSGDVVTTGGTGFGVMAMIVAAERGFITRAEALARVQKITTFLSTKCTRYHGAFAHWVNGQTGATQAFSMQDNGADLVETSLLIQGLLTARAYFDSASADEIKLRKDITDIWEAVEWTWFQKGGENALYWHWSPDYGWQMNLKIAGWNECLITYVLAASSPTYPISKAVYTQGWINSPSFINGKNYYGYTLPLGSDYGGPLFFSQYSFLGINPTGLTDQYANYLNQNRIHTLVNYNYCIQNPKGFAGYSADCWGLTASDGNNGYSAHSPTNDRGVIAPTAALSSMPYTPEESKQALRFFYYKLGDKLWKEYGFIDAFNLSEKWFDDQYIAIDQGPIIIMIENYRTQLLWKEFMSDPEIKQGLKNLGFQSPNL